MASIAIGPSASADDGQLGARTVRGRSFHQAVRLESAASWFGSTDRAKGGYPRSWLACTKGNKKSPGVQGSWEYALSPDYCGAGAIFLRVAGACSCFVKTT